MSSSDNIYLKTINNPDYTSIEPDREYSRGHEEYIRAPEILFGDQRKEIECTIKAFDEEEHHAVTQDLKETEREDAQYVTIDENPIDDRKTKTIELKDNTEVSNSTSSNKKGKVTNSHHRRKQKVNETEKKKFPGEIQQKKSRLRRYNNQQHHFHHQNQEKQEEEQMEVTSGVKALRHRRHQEEQEGEEEGEEIQMKRQMASSRPPSLTPPPPGPSQFQLEREKQMKAEQNLVYQTRLNTANMAVENHAQRKQLKAVLIQALTGACAFSQDDSQALKNHKESLRASLLSPQGTTLLSKLFLQTTDSQGASHGATGGPYGQVIQH